MPSAVVERTLAVGLTEADCTREPLVDTSAGFERTDVEERVAD